MVSNKAFLLLQVMPKTYTVHLLGCRTYNPQKMWRILVSRAYFNHSTKCNKLWCLSNWKTRYKPTPWMCACNKTQPPWVQQGHPQPEQMLQLPCQSVLHKVSLNWPKTPLFIFWMKGITYSTPFSSRMWNFVAVGHLWTLTNEHSHGAHHQICM
jgi:hypothetical protein